MYAMLVVVAAASQLLSCTFELGLKDVPFALTRLRPSSNVKSVLSISACPFADSQNAIVFPPPVPRQTLPNST
jgi:hypothetical protein